VPDPLNYETPPPPPSRKRPFWPEGWKAVEVVFLSFVFLGTMLADDYFTALGWPRWVRALVLLVVFYVGFWLSGQLRGRDFK